MYRLHNCIHKITVGELKHNITEDHIGYDHFRNDARELPPPGHKPLPIFGEKIHPIFILIYLLFFLKLYAY